MPAVRLLDTSPRCGAVALPDVRDGHALDAFLETARAVVDSGEDLLLLCEHDGVLPGPLAGWIAGCARRLAAEGRRLVIRGAAAPLRVQMAALQAPVEF